MPMYNLTEYSSICCETRGSIWFCSKDKTTDFDNDVANTDNFKFFKYKAKLLGNAVAQPTNGILENCCATKIFK